MLYSKYCGDKLNDFTEGKLHVPICDCTPPFLVRIYTNMFSDKSIAADPNTKPSRDVCYLRLDFLTFTIRGQVDSEEIMGGVCGDSFKV
eukprot:TCALIF_13822-PA protein Name:"Protein of unknown function" AED:0.63 eAED:0.63 QI:38/0/0/0.33/1/0.66/3/0/88